MQQIQKNQITSPDFFTCMLLALRAQERAITASNDPEIGLSRPVRIKPDEQPWHFTVECGISHEYDRQADVYHLRDAVESVIRDMRRLDDELEDAIDLHLEREAGV